jgi:hypothetical protein
MAQRKSRPKKKPVYSKIKDPQRPVWMKVLRIIAMVLATLLAFGAITGAIIKYYRLVSK